MAPVAPLMRSGLSSVMAFFVAVDKQMQRLAPNLIVPGAAKSGTTTLYEYLARHPDIDMASYKEPQLYSSDERYARRFDPTFPDSFARIFNREREVVYHGEASTTYMPSIEAARRIKDDVPDVKLIFILRDPVDRIVSHYNWLRSRALPLKPFREEIEADEAAGTVFDAARHFGGAYKYYLTLSRYCEQLSAYVDLFPKSNIHVMTFEGLRDDHVSTMNACFAFLGLAPLQDIGYVHSHKTVIQDVDLRPAFLQEVMRRVPKAFTWARAIRGLERVYRRLFYQPMPVYSASRDERKWLVSELRDDVERLSVLLDRQFPEWPEFSQATPPAALAMKEMAR
jgi:hypothetical protein